jgi:hypothetical protein
MTIAQTNTARHRRITISDLRYRKKEMSTEIERGGDEEKRVPFISLFFLSFFFS